MSLITAHKVLIVSAAIFFLFYALWELSRYIRGGGSSALVAAAVSLVVAVGWVFYFRTIRARRR